ncbi:hypothetical protein AB0J86_25765 [Micromonospora sp. NPDC049559]|uniref:tetratricopeptide repeat protein n=1 Tax=Micromonospora sp. NPDC049559 TaxID=3155923 RepID=UPI00343517A9
MSGDGPGEDLADLTGRAAALHERYRRDGDRAALDEAVALTRHAIEVGGPEWRNRLGANLATLLRLVADADGDDAALRESIALEERFVAEEPDPEPRMLLWHLDHLRGSYERLAETSGAGEAVGETAGGPAEPAGEATARALAVLRRAATVPDANRGYRLERLADALADRYEQTREPGLLRERADAYRELIAEVADPVDAPRRGYHLGLLAITLRELHAATGDPDVLDEAVATFGTAADTATTPAVRSMFAGETGRALVTRYQRRGDRADLDGALRRLTEAVEFAGSPQARSAELFALGNAYRELAERTGGVGDLRRAVESYRAALPHAEAEVARRCTANLAGALERLGQRLDDPAMLREAVELAGRAAAASPDLTARVMHWERLLAATRAPGTGPDAVEDLVRYARELVADADEEQRPARLSDLALSLMHLYDAVGAPEALAEGVRTSRSAVAAAAPGYPRRHRLLANLNLLLRREAAASGEVAPLDEAVSVTEQALAEVDEADPDRPSMHGELAAVLLHRYELSRRAADLHSAIAHAGAAVAGAATAGERAEQVAVLAMALVHRAFATGDPATLDEAIARCREALDLPLSPNHRVGTLVALVEAVVQRLKRRDLGDPAALDQAREALHICQEALANWPARTPGRDNLRRHLIALLGLLAAGSRSIPDLRAVAVAAGDLADATDWAPARHLAAVTYGAIFDRTAQRADIDAAIRHHLRSVEPVPPGDPERPRLLRLLGTAYRQRAKVTSSRDDLDAAVHHGRVAVVEAGPDGPELAAALAHQCANLRERFQLTGQLPDLDEAETVGRRAVAVAVSPGDRSTARTHLGAALMMRYQATGRAAALDEAITLGRSGIEVARGDEDADPPVPALTTLAVSLVMRYQLLGTLDDLGEAVELMRTAVAATADGDPQAPVRLGNAANVSRLRYEHTGDPADLAAAIGYADAALALVPPDNPAHPQYLGVLLATRLAGPPDPDAEAELDRVADRALAAGALERTAEPAWSMVAHNIGVALARRSGRTGSAAELDRAVDVLRLRLDRGRPDDPHLVETRIMLGDALSDRGGGSGPDHENAIRLWREASEQENARPERRLDAAVRWIRALDGEPAAQVTAYRQAITLLSLLAWHGAPRADQERALHAWPGIAGMAAAAALDAGRPEAAVELLEQGRTVLWSQLLDSRTDLSEVARAAPELAARMLAVRAELDTATDLLGDAQPPVVDPRDPGAPDPFALDELATAGELRMAGDVAAAEAVFVRYADAEHPSLAVAGAFGLGLIRYERGDVEGAVDALARSLATGQGGMAMMAGNLLAEVHLGRRDTDLARRALAGVLRIGADVDADEAAKARETLAALDELERDPSGQRLLIRPTLAGDDPGAMLGLAIRLFERGDNADALRLLERARQVAPPEAGPGIDLTRATVLAASGDVADAVEALRSASGAAEPEIADAAALGLADLLVEEGDPGEAREVYRRLIQGAGRKHARQARRRLADLDLPAVDPPAGPLAFDFGRWLAFREPYEDAVRALRAAVGAGDRSGRTQLYLALVHRNRDGEAAVRAYRLGVVLGEPDEPAVVAMCRAELRARRGDRAGARAGFASAYDLATRAGDVELAALAAVHLGMRLEAEGDRAGAVAAFRRAIRSGHRHHAAAAAFDLARMLASAGDRDGARAAYRQTFELEHPYQSPMAGINLAVMLREDGDDDAAAQVYRAVVEGPRPDSAARAALGLGRLLGDRGDVEGAKAAYRRSIGFGLPEESAPAAYNLGILLAMEGDRDAARAAFRQARGGPDPRVTAAATDALRRLRRQR